MSLRLGSREGADGTNPMPGRPAIATLPCPFSIALSMASRISSRPRKLGSRGNGSMKTGGAAGAGNTAPVSELMCWMSGGRNSPDPRLDSRCSRVRLMVDPDMSNMLGGEPLAAAATAFSPSACLLPPPPPLPPRAKWKVPVCASRSKLALSAASTFSTSGSRSTPSTALRPRDQVESARRGRALATSASRRSACATQLRITGSSTSCDDSLTRPASICSMTLRTKSSISGSRVRTSRNTTGMSATSASSRRSCRTTLDPKSMNCTSAEARPMMASASAMAGNYGRAC